MIELSPNQIPEDLKKYFKPKRKYGPFINRNQIVWWKRNCMPSSVKDRFTVDWESVQFFVANKKYWFEQQYEPVKQCSIERLDRAVSNQNKWVNGASGQTPHNLSQPRPNRNYKGGSNIGRKNNCAISTYQFNNGDYLVSPFNPQKGKNMRCVWDIPTKGFSGAHFAVFPVTLVEPMIKSGCPPQGTVLDPFCGSGTTGIVAKKLGRKFIGIDLSEKYIKEIAVPRLQSILL